MKSLILIAALLAATAALARENPAWKANSAEIRAWFQGLMQPDNPTISCCGEADAYYADEFEATGDKYVAVITDERVIPGRPSVAPGTRIVIPNEKIKWDKGNPTGHGIVFLSYTGAVYCYVVPAGG